MNKACNNNCKTCVTTATTCTDCNSPNYLYNGSCGTCPDGYFAEITTIRQCTKCDNNCTKCVNSSTNCTACLSTNYLDNVDNICKPCNYTCLSNI